MSTQWPPPDGDAAPPGSGGPYPPDAYPPPTYPPYSYPPYSYPPNDQPAAGPPWPPPGQASPFGPPPHWATAPPRRLSDQPPVRPRRRSGWLVTLFGVTGLVVVGLVAALAAPFVISTQAPGHVRTPDHAPSASVPASPSASPTPTMPTDPKVIVKKNPIYAIKVPASCPPQRIPASKTAFRTQVKALVSCENAAWRKALAKTPVTFAKPKVVFYNTSTTSPCGKLGTSYPAAYCTSDRTLYFSTAAYAQGRYYRLAVAQFVMHEYAHHVQELAGIFASSWALEEKSTVTTRRIELQAHCMAHYQLTHSQLGFSANDRAEAEFQFSYTTDAKGHGSVAAERYWGRRGLSASKIGACNTWTVRASRVK